MRLGEIRNILWEILNSDNKISIKQEEIFGGQAHIIKNYGAIISALDVLANQGWNQLDYSPIQSIKQEYGEIAEIQLSQEKFNQLNSYISSLNQVVPLYVSIIETMVEDQDEHTINIKLPESIVNLSDLTSTNSRLNNILQLYNADGQFEFRGFDKGTNWYVVVAMGVLSYRFLIAGLDIAQKYFDTRKSYFDSEMAKMDLKAALNKGDVTNKELENYKERKLSILIEEGVKKAIEKIGVGSNNENELTTKIIKATTSLIKELDEEGTEFHLSLNPPEYATELMGSLVIDYSKIPMLKNEEKDEEVKQITQADEGKKNGEEN